MNSPIPSMAAPQMAEEAADQIFAHMSEEEVAFLDQTQGGPTIDEERNLRYYGPELIPVLSDPRVQEIFAQMMESVPQGYAEGGAVEPGLPVDPELEKLRAAGQGNNTQLVILDAQLADILKEINGGQVDENPDTTFPEFGKVQAAVKHLARGGRIVGPGTAKSDSIPRSIPDGTYIIDNESVKKLGNDSTQKGFKVLDQLTAALPKGPSGTPGGMIKAMLSNGEYEIPPEKVTAIGDGSNDKGAKMLDKFRRGLKAAHQPKKTGGLLKQLTQAGGR